MLDKHEQTGMERTIRLYPWYALTLNAYFWMPVFVLYFLKHMPLESLLRLEGIYYLSVVLLEVPSGYFSDRIGRRPTLIIACTLLALSYCIFAIGGSFAVFAVAQVLLAGGLAFNSGTDTSLHYDALASIDREGEYDTREATVARNALFASGIGGIVGGACGLIDLRIAYALSALAAIASLLLVLLMREPQSHEHRLVPNGPVTQLRTCLTLTRQPLLAWTLAYFVLMTVLNHVPYEFYQPYTELAFKDHSLVRDGSPLIAGLHMGIAMLLATVIAGRSIRLRDRVGYKPLLLLASLLQLGIIAAMGLVLHPMILLIVLMRSIPRALTAAPINAAVAPLVPRAQRATYLSIQSLAGRLAFASTLFTLAAISHDSEVELWASLSQKLLLTLGLGLIGFTALALIRGSKPTA